MMDILDQISLSEVAVVLFKDFAQRLGAACAAAGVWPDEISEEQAREDSDGSLVIWVDIPGAHLEFTIPKGHWAYNNRN